MQVAKTTTGNVAFYVASQPHVATLPVVKLLQSKMSRGGLEPPTRRLRVCCSTN